ncbi:hypothetical protein F2P79_022684 [Pimephales promelas]|nr:hypothetical protein F2P79_022684 [Pimephales promelas]
MGYNSRRKSYLSIVSDHVHRFMATMYPSSDELQGSLSGPPCPMLINNAPVSHQCNSQPIHSVARTQRFPFERGPEGFCDWSCMNGPSVFCSTYILPGVVQHYIPAASPPQCPKQCSLSMPGPN